MVTQLVLLIRRRSGLGLRELARRAGTSHATLHAYETGAKVPKLDTVERIARAAGFHLEVQPVRAADPPQGPEAKGRELAEAVDLAERFPARHHRRLRAPVFGPAAVGS